MGCEDDLDFLWDVTLLQTAESPLTKRRGNSNSDGCQHYSPLTGDKLTQGEAWLFENPSIGSHPDRSIYRSSCYICNDPDYAQMGMPLCSACEVCKVGHIAADDSVCDNCGYDICELVKRENGC